MKQVNIITLAELENLAEQMYGDFAKAVVDLKKNALVVGLEMHADGEAQLLEAGSNRTDLWGINLYPSRFGTNEFIEFESMINIRPSQKNMTRSVEDIAIRKKIIELVAKKIVP